MSELRNALRHYVHFLHGREGQREIKLTRGAQLGLVKLLKEPQVAVEGSRRPPGDGASPSPVAAPVSDRRPPAPVVASPAPVIATAPVREPVAHRPAPQAETPPVSLSGNSKVEQLAHLAERASVCVKCPHLAARRTNVVFGVGNPDAKLMFVGEAPGEDEDELGEPFVGRAGQLLTKMILAMGLTREQVYIANVVKCRPDMPLGASGNRKPTKQEMETCLPYLRAQIEVIQPVALVALGATAVEGLIGSVGSIGSLRGRFLEFRGTPLMPTYHPAFLLRNPNDLGNKRKVWEDLLQVMERLQLPISQKQRGYFLKA